MSDADRNEIEAETAEILVGAAELGDELGAHPEELVASAREALERIFFEARCQSKVAREGAANGYHADPPQAMSIEQNISAMGNKVVEPQLNRPPLRAAVKLWR